MIARIAVPRLVRRPLAQRVPGLTGVRGALRVPDPWVVVTSVSRGRICELCTGSVSRRFSALRSMSGCLQVSGCFECDASIVLARRLEDLAQGGSTALTGALTGAPQACARGIRRSLVSNRIQCGTQHVHPCPAARTGGITTCSNSRRSGRARLDGLAGRVSTVWPGASRRCCRARLGEGEWVECGVTWSRTAPWPWRRR